MNYKPLLALAIVLAPHCINEVFLSVTNIQWILPILPIIILMKERPDCKYGNVNIQMTLDFLIVIICGLTGPFMIFLTPFFAYKWFKNKDLYNFGIMSAVIITSCIQLSLILFTPHAVQNNHLVFSMNDYCAIVGHKVFGGLFLGKTVAYKINHYFLCAMYFCLLFAILKSSSLKNNFINIYLSIQLLMLLGSFYRLRAMPEALIPIENGQRYFYIPYVMMIWSLIALLGRQEKWKNALIIVALISILFSSLTSDFYGKKFIDYNWKLQSESIGEKDTIIPINPEGWTMPVKARPK